MVDFFTIPQLVHAFTRLRVNPSTLKLYSCLCHTIKLKPLHQNTMKKPCKMQKRTVRTVSAV